MDYFNPVVVKIRMKKCNTTKAGKYKSYFIGNSDMDISLKDTVVKFYPPAEDGDRIGTLIINRFQPEKEEDQDDREDLNDY